MISVVVTKCVYFALIKYNNNNKYKYENETEKRVSTNQFVNTINKLFNKMLAHRHTHKNKHREQYQYS